MTIITITMTTTGTTTIITTDDTRRSRAAAAPPLLPAQVYSSEIFISSPSLRIDVT